MTSSPHGRPPARRGFFASLSDALTPRPIPEDDTGPLKPPRSVIAAMALALVAAVIHLFWGGYIVVGLGSIIDQSKQNYADQIADCTRDFGGIGSTAITAASPTGSAKVCQQTVAASDVDWGVFQTWILGQGIFYLVLAVVLGAAALFLRPGRTWARRTVVGAAIAIVLGSFVWPGDVTILFATLLMIVAVVLCYLRSGATYFLRVKARQHG